MTKNEIKSALTEAGISFRAKATLEELTLLYAPVVQAADAAYADANPLPAYLSAPAPTDDAVTQHEAVVSARTEATADATPTSTGLKIEKDRPEQNGIKRPSAGGKCRAIWDALDEYRAETGELPTSKTVKELAADSGWNPNNASIEYYQWRKFNGIAKGA